MNIGEKVTKSEGDGNHPSSHYLVVEDPNKPSTWHLRVRGTDGKPDHTLMGAAWAALHGGYRGNKYEGPNKAQALSKLMRLYASEGMKTPGGSKSILYKDKNGQSWFIGIYSNNFEDRHGEIISEEAHEDYIAWLKSTGIKPPIVLVHQPQFPKVVHFAHYLGLVMGRFTTEEFNQNLLDMYKSTAVAQTQSVFTMNGFVFVIGKVFNNKEDVVQKLLARKDSWGMSHGFIVVKVDDNIIEKYRSFEFSLLPGTLSANVITPISFSEGAMMATELKGLSSEDRDLLEEILTSTSEDDLEAATSKARDILSKVLASKALDTPEEPDKEEEAEDKKDEEEDKQEEKTAEKSYEEIRVKLFEDFKLPELTELLKTVGEKIETLEQKIASQAALIGQLEAKQKQLEETDDAKIAAQFAAPDWSLGMKKASEKPEQELVEELKKNLPDAVVEHKEMDSKNPLDLGLWGQFRR